MKKVLLAMLFAAFAIPTFTACNDNDDDKPTKATVTAKSITGAEAVKKVKAFYSANENDTEITTVDFKDGGFTFDLPATIEDSKLEAIKKEDFPTGVTMTVDSYKSAHASFEAFDDTKKIGDFYEVYEKKDANGVVGIEAGYIYSDKAFKITGKGTEKETINEGGENEEEIDAEHNYNVDIKKGWNKVYTKREEVYAQGETKASVKYTFQTASFSEVKWMYEADNVEPQE